MTKPRSWRVSVAQEPRRLPLSDLTLTELLELHRAVWLALIERMQMRLAELELRIQEDRARVERAKARTNNDRV